MPKTRACQHLHDKEIQYCQVFIDGVFIPMQTHLDHFCRSGNCGECFQFMKSQEHLRHAQKESYTELNKTRRQHLRFSQEWQLFITTDPTPTHNLQIALNQAQTIDISTGGFRLTSRQKLTPTERVHFIFEKGLSAPFSAGSGEIIWTKPDKITGGFQSGLALLRESYT